MKETKKIKISTSIIFFILKMLLVADFVLFIFIAYSSRNIIELNLTYVGFNEFQEIFSFPINLAAVIITIFGAVLAYTKFSQDNKNFKDQFLLNQNNIYINNYYQHKEEFIKYIKRAIDALDLPIMEEQIGLFDSNETYRIKNDHNKFKTSEYKISQLFIRWFGHINENVDILSIKSDMLKIISSFYNNYKKSRPKGSGKNFEPTDGLQKDLEQLGLIELFPNSYNRWENYSKTRVAITICKAILEFSGQSIKNESEIYELANIN